jgi:hypothetical protein
MPFLTFLAHMLSTVIALLVVGNYNRCFLHCMK